MSWNYKFIINEKDDNFKNLITQLSQIPSVKLNISDYEINITANNTYKIKESVLTNIAYYLVKTFKYRYFYTEISKQNLPQHQTKALSKALTLFDIESDIFLTLNMLPEESVVATSFYVFKMSKLKDKWEEFVLVTNINSPYLANREVYIEFLKFLYSAIEPQCDEVNIVYHNNGIVLKDKFDNNLASPIEVDDEMSIITNLIYLAPNVINLHCLNCLPNKIFKTLYYIFNKKINLMV